MYELIHNQWDYDHDTKFLHPIDGILLTSTTDKLTLAKSSLPALVSVLNDNDHGICFIPHASLHMHSPFPAIVLLSDDQLMNYGVLNYTVNQLDEPTLYLRCVSSVHVFCPALIGRYTIRISSYADATCFKS